MKPPYPSKTAALGGVPTNRVDTPITAVFIVLFLIGAVAHMAIFLQNKRKGHKFIMSGMMFGFCMARTATCVMRIVWANRPTNVRVAIAAQIFVAAGVILLFVVNIIFTQRILRATHPHSGWHPLFSLAFKAVYVLVILTLAMLITSVIQSFYTLNNNTHRIDRDIQLYGQTFYTIISFAPIPMIVGGLIIPRKTRVEKFGSGRFRTKVAILLVSAFLLCLGASYRVGTSFKTPRPRNESPAYLSKACFYIFNFTVEILVIYLYVILRVDMRFYIPNGAHMAGDYEGRNADKHSSDDTLQGMDSREGDVEKQQTHEGPMSRMESRIMSEEEVFDDEPEEPRQRGQL